MNEQFLRGQVIRILDDQRLLINLGMEHGVSTGDRFFIYEEGEEIKDPKTGETLEMLELVKAQVEAIHVQDKITLVSPLLEKLGQKQTVLSATLAQVYSSEAQSEDKSRGKLNVRKDQMTGMFQSGPIAVGDSVRSEKAKGSVPVEEVPEEKENNTTKEKPSSWY